MSNLWKFKNFLPNQTGNRHILSVFVFSFLFNRKVFVKYLLSFCKVFAGTCTGGRTSSKPNRADTSRRLKFVCQQSLKPDDNSTQRLIQSRFKFQVAGDKGGDDGREAQGSCGVELGRGRGGDRGGWHGGWQRLQLGGPGHQRRGGGQEAEDSHPEEEESEEEEVSAKSSSRERAGEYSRGFLERVQQTVSRQAAR